MSLIEDELFNLKYRSINSFYRRLIVDFSNDDLDLFLNRAREFFLKKISLFNLNNNSSSLFNFDAFFLKDNAKMQNELFSFNDVTIEVNLKMTNQFNDLTN